MSRILQLKNMAIAIREKILPKTEFDRATIPWIDHEDPDINSFVKNFKPRFPLTFNLEEKLRFWQKNGYVVLENVTLPYYF
jgi:hypothetical protein